ncbi:MAG TPA: hypothetical protein VH677_03035 [Nitrososphaera sp.]
MEGSAKAIIIGLAAALAVVSGIAVYDFQQTEPQIQSAAMTEDVQFLFVQHAGSGSLEQDGDAYRLTLNDVSESTVRFADRPYRYIDSVSTGSFVESWSFGDDSFEDDPPNAALTLDETGGQKTIVVELLNPVYDEGTKNLTYDVVEIGENISQSGISEFGQATLVIDNEAGTFPVQHGLCRMIEVGIFECDCEYGYIQDGSDPFCVQDDSR